MGRLNKKLFRQCPEPYERKAGIPSGGAVLLCTMAALCLTGLSLLSLNTAGAAKRLSDACVENVKGYYGACLDANQDMAGQRENGSAGSYSGEYRVSDVQVLSVRYSVNDEGRYHIDVWQQKRDGEWVPDTGLDVAK